TVRSERLDYWRIREGKERGDLSLRAIGVLVTGPSRDGKDISLFPSKALALNDTPPCSLQDHVDTTTRLAMRLCVHAGAQILRCAPQGRQDRATGVRIGVLQEQIIVGGRDRLRQGRQGRGSAAPFVIQQRRKVWGVLGLGWAQPGLMIQTRRDIVWLRNAVLFTGGVLRKDDIQGFEEWQIQTIQPDHWFGRLIAVIMPGP